MLVYYVRVLQSLTRVSAQYSQGVGRTVFLSEGSIPCPCLLLEAASIPWLTVPFLHSRHFNSLDKRSDLHAVDW